MEATVKKEVTVTLKMNEEEATWLKGLFQNPLIDNESDLDKDMRKRFFEAIILENYWCRTGLLGSKEEWEKKRQEREEQYRIDDSSK